MQKILCIINFKYFFYLSLIVFFAGCTNQSRIDSNQTSEKSSGEVVVEPSNSTSTNPALGHLHDLASEAVAAKDYDKASSLLERALRLAPYRAITYLELAKVKVATGDILQALVFAERGLLYCEYPFCRALNSFIENTKTEPPFR